MSHILNLKQQISQGKLDAVFTRLYGGGISSVCYQKNRYLEAISSFEKLYPNYTEVSIFSAPGRSEISGNHTDHNHGKALAAAIDLDIIAVVAKDARKLQVHSQGFEPDILSIDDIAFKENEKNTSKALLKGICDGLCRRGYNYGGFVAYTHSNVLKGSGISSSAAFEVLICTIQNCLYNRGQIDLITIAQIAQYAENNFFKKPCGLLDQIACSVGGIITIDFFDSEKPEIEKIDFNLEKSGYALCMVDTGGNHADLTHEYAAIPNEMKSVAAFFKKEFLRGVSREDISQNAKELRQKLGDRALLRALHYVDENKRVELQAAALKNGNFKEFLKQVRRSGRSSFMYLQNVFSSQNITEQGLSLALCLSDGLLDHNGAYRVHGGGFGGTIQAFIPITQLNSYRQVMDNVFGKGACKTLNVRPFGGIMITD